MEFKGRHKEFLRLKDWPGHLEIDLENRLPGTLTILWNYRGKTHLKADAMDMVLEEGQIAFLTEFPRIQVLSHENIRLVQFNRPFYCVVDHDSEVGCKGILFFGAVQVPVIQVPPEETEKFELLWRMFCIEMESPDNLQFSMLQMMLKRLIILSTRIYKEQTGFAGLSAGQADLIREYHFLVERHFRVHHSVSAYAGFLNKSPKTLANLFAQNRHPSPISIIHDRLLVEANRLLLFSEMSVKEIGYFIGFEDVQSFSRFYRRRAGISPSVFREQSRERHPGKTANLSGTPA